MIAAGHLPDIDHDRFLPGVSLQFPDPTVREAHENLAVRHAGDGGDRLTRWRSIHDYGFAVFARIDLDQSLGRGEPEETDIVNPHADPTV